MMRLNKKWVIGLMICFALLALFSSGVLKKRELPLELHGTWENSDPDYKDRYFLLNSNAIGFGTGNDRVDWYKIISVSEKTEGNKTLYTIEYQKPEGAPLKKTLYYLPENDGIIKFKNQKEIQWYLTSG